MVLVNLSFKKEVNLFVMFTLVVVLVWNIALTYLGETESMVSPLLKLADL